MNTVAHLVLNLLTLERPQVFYRWPRFAGQGKLPIAPLVWGALVPDLPMVVFYGVEKFIFGQSEQYIWGSAYFSQHWSDFIDLFNSIPLIALGFAICWWWRSQWGWLFFMGMLLHVLGDLPLHHDDGHRHFFPLSDWRFQSPISYWDPNHYGGIVSLLEAIAVLVACIILWRSYRSRWGKGFMGFLIALDSVLLIFLISRLF